MADYSIDRLEMEDVLKLANPRVKKNTEIITPDLLGQDKLYHIALDKRNKFFPNISKRAANSEDNTLPRVHTAPTLIGCYFGYAGVGDLATNFIPENTKKTVSNTHAIAPYKGGFYIHEIDFRCAVKPNTSLVFDCDLTDEIWLVTYNEYTKYYPAKVIGMLFTHAVKYIPRTGKSPIEVCTLFCRIDRGNKIKFCLNNKWVSPDKNNPLELKEGYYKFDIDDQRQVTELTKISEKEFNDNKLYSAGMLSYQ